MSRHANELYPDLSAHLREIKEKGISSELLQKIIQKHMFNSEYNKKLYGRYMTIKECVPIFGREPRFAIENVDGKRPLQINNKVNNDFFGEIVDFKVGYFAGKPISYSYSSTEESVDDTGGEEAVNIVKKELSDFVTRNNLYNVDMEITKHAAIYGYAGRLFYHDTDGYERVMAVPGYECIFLPSINISEPEYAIRYYQTEDINGELYWTVEFYDSNNIYTYEGQLGNLNLVGTAINLYGYCPLQGIPNNDELLGDAEKVLSSIDSYDKTVSDSSNQIEGQVHSKEIYENVNITQEEIVRSNYTGALQFYNGSGNGRIYKLESNINDNFVEHHLDRLRDNIYRFSKTPNLNDEKFAGSSSGVSLRHKLIGLEAKCGMFQAKLMTSNVYMFKLLSNSWSKKKISVDPLQCTCEFKRNFPLDSLNNAQAAQALIGSGIPKEVAWGIAIPEIDDVDYVMQLAEKEMDGIKPLEDPEPDEDLENEESETVKN